MIRGIYSLLWYPSEGSGQPFIELQVVSASLPTARRHAYQYLREEGYHQGELWTISAEENDPFWHEKGIHKTIGVIDVDPHCHVPSWWAEKMHSGWPKTHPLSPLGF